MGWGRNHRGGQRPHVDPEPDVTTQAPPTFWDRVQDVLEEARLVAGSTPGTIVAGSIIVIDDDGEVVREWELDEEP